MNYSNSHKKTFFIAHSLYVTATVQSNLIIRRRNYSVFSVPRDTDVNTCRSEVTVTRYEGNI